MEITYILAGMRFNATDHSELSRQLIQFGLVANLDSRGFGSLTVRRMSEPQGTARYDIVQSFGDSADFKGYDVCVGKLIGNKNYGEKSEVIEVEISELEKALVEIKKDIPEAKILVGSYWS